MNAPPPCPFLPSIEQEYRASELARFRPQPKTAEFYLIALKCAQSRWLSGLPAQALLMLNRAFTVDFRSWSVSEQSIIDEHPPPYAAVQWMVLHGDQFGFLGNPRRHFQHLATRMSGELSPLRIARAWACWEIVKTARPDFAPDERQLDKEDITEPSFDRVSRELKNRACEKEFKAWLNARHSIKKDGHRFQ